LEHLQHFGLTQDPFSNEPDLRFYFDSACHKEALLRVERGLRQNKGLTILCGQAGTGKTLLARRVYESLEEEIFEPSLMVMLPGAADAQSLLVRFAKQLGVEEPASDRSGVLGQIYEQLAIVREDGRHAVLIIDDAHVLTPEVMAEVGGLLNMEYEEKRLISLLLVGLPEMADSLAGDAAMLQRVDVRVQLQPLDLPNTSAYVKHRLGMVGARTETLPALTVETLFKLGRGRPRLINTLADNALFEAYLGGRGEVEPNDVERAASDLGIGPDPGATYSQAMPPARPIAAPPSPQEMSDALAPQMATTVDTSLLLGAAMSESAEAPVADFGVAMQDGEGASGADLGALLDGSGSEPEPLSMILDEDLQGSGETLDLDAEVEAVLSEQIEEPMPSFETENDAGIEIAEATRAAMDEPPLEAVSNEIAELDDLFVELIEED
jgi:type II secretory pathway predicted ATPase ExeA